MVGLLSSITTAITIAKRLRDVSDKIKDADFKNLLAELTLNLADIKMQLAEVLEENTQLKAKVRALEAVEGDPCPKCHKRGWEIESSSPDPTFGELGGIQRIYKCSLCGFTENKFISPS
jgi:regulator of replication initiation timing